MGTAFAVKGTQQGILAPYKVVSWSNIPADAKAADGTWFADYGGYVAIGYNSDKVKTAPTSFADLLKPEYKNQVAINGNPTQASAAFSAVFASALANGGSLDNISPGIAYFKKLYSVGNFVPVTASAATMESGQTPIIVWWDYLLASEIGPSVKGLMTTNTTRNAGAVSDVIGQARDGGGTSVLLQNLTRAFGATRALDGSGWLPRPGSTRTSYPAAGSSASRWPGRWPSSPGCCCSTSRCPRWTPRCGCSFASRSAGCSSSSAPRPCSSPTTRRKPCRWRTGSVSCARASSSRSPRRTSCTPTRPPRSWPSSSA
jgi:hypothetical protein